MLDCLFDYFYAGKVAQREAFDQRKKMRFNLNPSFSLKWGGGGGYMAASEWTPIRFIQWINLGRLFEEL